MISLKYKFLFVHIPKTAGNSVQNILKNYSEDKIVCSAPFQDGVERFGVVSERYGTCKHSMLKDYRDGLGDEVFEKLFKFTSVRNPWDRLISGYFSPHMGVRAWDKALFKNLVAEVPPITAYLSLKGRDDVGLRSFRNIDRFIRFESIDDDFKEVCGLIGIPWEPLPIRNKSRRQQYARYYDAELAELVRNKFRDEIDFFGYKFESDA